MSSENEKAIVFKSCPELERLFEKEGKERIADYLSSIHKPPQALLKQELIETVKELAQTYIGTEAADKAEEVLNQNWKVSTADHHGILNHPFSLHSILVQKTIAAKLILAFPCAGVSLDNSSVPRGFFWHDLSGKEERLYLHGYKNRHMSVFSAPAVSISDIEEKYRYGSDAQKKLVIFLKEIWKEKDSYKAQCAAITYELSKMIGFKETPVIFIDQESIIVSLLNKFHLDKDTVLTSLLTQETWLDSFEKKFDGLQGAFSKTKGSFLFWYINPDTRVRERLFYKTKKLRAESGWEIALDAQKIKEALSKNLLMPTMALSFIVLSFYYGLVTPGGFLQIEYADKLKKAWQALLKEVQQVEPFFLESLPTNLMGGDWGIFFTEAKKRASTVDFFFSLPEQKEREQFIHEVSEKITLEEALNGMMQEYIKILTGKNTSYVSEPKPFQIMPRVRK